MSSETAYFRGFPANRELAEWLEVFERYLLHLGVIKKRIDIYQLIGGYIKSGGTHAGGDAFDIAQVAIDAIEAARNGGAPGTWHRPKNWDSAGGMEHTHGGIVGGGHATQALRDQTYSTAKGVLYGKNGLANGGPDAGPKGFTVRDYKDGIAWMEAQMKAAEPTIWRVAVDRLYPHIEPSASSPTAKGSVGYGGSLPIVETKVVYGTMWGRTSPGRWWILGGGRASKTPPPQLSTAAPSVMPGAWYVAADRLYPHTEPRSSSPVAKGSVGRGGTLPIVETKIVYGTLWGRTSPGRWWILGGGRADTSPPPEIAEPAPLVPVGFSETATWNVCASLAPAGEKDWATNRSLRVARRLASEDVDVALIQESGSGADLDALDEALKQTPSLVRTLGGTNWRQVVRNKDTTTWVAGTMIGIAPAVDSDGNQIRAVVLKQHGVLIGRVSGHLDVKATTQQKANQADSAIVKALAWFKTQDVDQINVGFGLDTNDKTGAVAAVFRKYGFGTAFELAESTSLADFKTNNLWSDTPVALAEGAVGLDQLFLDLRVRVTDAHQIWDADTADHNFQSAIHAVYANA